MYISPGVLLATQAAPRSRSRPPRLGHLINDSASLKTSKQASSTALPVMSLLSRICFSFTTSPQLCHALPHVITPADMFHRFLSPMKCEITRKMKENMSSNCLASIGNVWQHHTSPDGHLGDELSSHNLPGTIQEFVECAVSPLRLAQGSGIHGDLYVRRWLPALFLFRRPAKRSLFVGLRAARVCISYPRKRERARLDCTVISKLLW